RPALSAGALRSIRTSRFEPVFCGAHQSRRWWRFETSRISSGRAATIEPRRRRLWPSSLETDPLRPTGSRPASGSTARARRDGGPPVSRMHGARLWPPWRSIQRLLSLGSSSVWADSDDLSLEPQQSHCLFLSAPWSVGVYGVAVYACLH